MSREDNLLSTLIERAQAVFEHDKTYHYAQLN